jgi:hypothetical protein
MAYNPLRTEADTDDEFEVHQTPQSRRVFNSRHLILCVLAAQTILILGLYAALRNSLSKIMLVCDEETKDDTITIQYGFNPKRMTIDHKYDYLWNVTEDSGIVISSDGFADGHLEQGSITMYATVILRHC